MPSSSPRRDPGLHSLWRRQNRLLSRKTAWHRQSGLLSPWNRDSARWRSWSCLLVDLLLLTENAPYLVASLATLARLHVAEISMALDRISDGDGADAGDAWNCKGCDQADDHSDDAMKCKEGCGGMKLLHSKVIDFRLSLHVRYRKRRWLSQSSMAVAMKSTLERKAQCRPLLSLERVCSRCATSIWKTQKPIAPSEHLRFRRSSILLPTAYATPCFKAR